MNPTRNDLPESTRAKVAALLNDRLADLLDLHSQVKQAHWNIKGPSFIALHELFDEIAGSLAEHADTTAERAVQLGATARGTVRLAAAASSLPEYPQAATNQGAHLTALADRLAAVGRSAQAAIETAAKLGDTDTADLFTAVSRSLDKHLWFVESHLQG
ncbi:MAG: DNA starvation/stationary phase protection protein Dps [Phycisphaeraceae bacterium]|nr:DNA starvation/stationary phase protection protein Dps [Phycisphaeraceae bacterium]